jgi:predicted LPLAT superfamily acyltransferase
VHPVPFIGAPAEFPDAPFLIAAALRVPVVLSFGLYRGGNRYDLYFEAFEIEHDVPRAQRRAALARMQARYAQRLEHHVRLAPYNWFNFYDFWRDDARSVPKSPAGAAVGPAAGPAGGGGGDRGAA